MSERMSDRPAPFHGLRQLRPLRDAGLARRVGLGSVLEAVLGESRRVHLERFVLERRVGEGGMGVVYRGHDPRAGCPVAIKVMDPRRAKEHARFEAEARTLGALHHPNIVRYLEHGRSSEGDPFLVMEWLDGNDLARRLERGPLSVAEAIGPGGTGARRGAPSRDRSSRRQAEQPLPGR